MPVSLTFCKMTRFLTHNQHFPVSHQLIRKDGEFHSSRLLDEKDMQASQNVLPKKKNRKSGLPSKMREKPQASDQSVKSIILRVCLLMTFTNAAHINVPTECAWSVILCMSRWSCLMLTTITRSALKCKRTLSVSTATAPSAAATIWNDTFLPIRVMNVFILSKMSLTTQRCGFVVRHTLFFLNV